MRSFSLPLLLSFIALPTELIGAVRFDLHGRAAPRLLDKRTAITGASALTDTNNLLYYLNLTLGGSQFQVAIDTGSADLWVAGNVTNSQDTGKTRTVQYVGEEATGTIKLATLDFLGYTVENQAFLDVAANSQNETAGTGLIGLGPHVGSEIQETLGNGTGDPPLDRIFQQDKTTPNYITVLLGRAFDPADEVPGNFTIGEVLPGYSNLTSQPKLNVTAVPSGNQSSQHWQTLLDVDGIIGPNGQAVDVQTVVSSTSNKKQLTVVFDSGYSLPQVPANVAQAFYGNVPGAQLMNASAFDGQVWVIPCQYEVNVSFVFGGVRYPINPLDTNAQLPLTGEENDQVCYGAFQPISAASNSFYDVILGGAFLRNVYMLINYGDFADNATNARAEPYIQLLSTSNDSAQIHSEFIKLRGTSSWSSDESWIHRHLALVIGVSVGAAVGVILLALGLMRRRRLGRTPAGFVNFQSSYKPLSEPAPPEAHDMGHMSGSHPPPYDEAPTRSGYANPWDSNY